MLVPTCREPLCVELDIPKPYYDPESPPGFSDPPSPTEWLCGACGKPCEVVEQPDQELADAIHHDQ